MNSNVRPESLPKCLRIQLDCWRRFVALVVVVVLVAATMTSEHGRSSVHAQDAAESTIAFPLPTSATDILKHHCRDCHSVDTTEGALNLDDLIQPKITADQFRRWVRLLERIQQGEMPPAQVPQPTDDQRRQLVTALTEQLSAVEPQLIPDRGSFRRLTRLEYENTIRDLFALPGIALSQSLPADGNAHGFDRTADALDISHVNLARWLDSADQILDSAIATRPFPPSIQTRRISLVNRGGFVAHVVMNGDGILLKDGQPDPEFPPAADQNHLDQGAHERWGSFDNGASVGLFRHDDESFSPYFIEHVTIYPGRYRVRTSLWSFQWDKGRMLPGRGTEAARLSVIQLTGDGRGGQHPGYVLGYFDAPPEQPLEQEFDVWLNHNEIMGFNTASLAPVANYARPGRAMAFTGPGIVVDWLEVEGPLHPVWPPESHQLLFGELPLAEFDTRADGHLRPPRRINVRQLGAGMNRRDPEPGLWTVRSWQPLDDARRLLTTFLPQLFRRPVAADVCDQYVEIVNARLQSGDCFETAMRTAFRTA
ncbi:MAG: DUF1587 domain-containing protein, partial [Planctomycetaceae bacterium]|nr:DUF1587 domain-containing protein [Planctomycetaceae bacterium]